ncbi:MAG: Glycogen synthase [Parcubacteria group bacterium GW2011_GWC1_43_61]|nr:MAG: Glycosyl transferase group 1 [Candidatus Azambacteria bacterium GW2011_GWB1_42_72]KKT16444.1 MAG: Glycogen synthase [Parcubacteria group bacterium GW2011_GWC1_43_61]
MKIIILSDYFDNRGGAVSIAKTMAYGFKQMGHNVGVITTVQDKALAGQKIIDGVKIWSVYSNYNLFWRAYRSLYNPQTVKHIAKIIEEIKPDVVHANNIHVHLSYHALKIAQKSGARVFLTAHDVMPFHYGKLTEFINPNNLSCPEKFNYKISVWRQIKRAGKTYNPFRNLIIRYYLEYVDKIFAVSGALKNALNDNGIKNVEVIHNGIDVSAWAVNEAAIEVFKEKHNIRNKKVVLFGGRLGWLKGGREICLAMKKVIETIPNAVLLLAGKIDEEVKEILDFADKLGINKNIIAAGWLSGGELKAAYNVADIVTAPSICFDSFPTVNLEAMACKKPVIATCFGGSREAVIDGETGYIVNPFNIDKLADKIIYLLKNSEVARKFGEAGYERVKKEFSSEKMIGDYLNWYGKIF